MKNMTSEELAQAVRDRIAELHAVAPGSIGDLMEYRVVPSTGDELQIAMVCKTFDWMRNGPGTLHGGMCATVVDQAMGFVAYCLKPGEGTAPTVQMNLAYHRPLIPAEDALVRVTVESAGKTLIHLSAKAYRVCAPEKLCLSASAVYFYQEKR